MDLLCSRVLVLSHTGLGMSISWARPLVVLPWASNYWGPNTSFIFLVASVPLIIVPKRRSQRSVVGSKAVTTLIFCSKLRDILSPHTCIFTIIIESLDLSSHCTFVPRAPLYKYIISCITHRFRCTFVPLYLRSVVPSSRCTFVPLYLRPVVPSFRCTFVPLYLRPVVPSSRCTFVPSSQLLINPDLSQYQHVGIQNANLKLGRHLADPTPNLVDPMPSLLVLAMYISCCLCNFGKG